MRNSSNVAKETNPVETTTSVWVTCKFSRSEETEIVNEKVNQSDSTFVFQKTAFAKQNRSYHKVYIKRFKKDLIKEIIILLDLSLSKEFFPTDS